MNMVNCDPLDVYSGKIQAEAKDLCEPAYMASQADEIPLLSLDIGGTFIKLVYYTNDGKNCAKEGNLEGDNVTDFPFLDGRLRFLKFGIKDLDGCLDFLRNSQAFNSRGPTSGRIRILATGGGSYKYEDLFKDRLGITLEKVDEVVSFAAGANFLLKNIRHEAFTYAQGRAEYLDINPNNIYPYLLVNLGTGVSFIKVTGDQEADLIFGTNFGSGTVFGLAKLLTQCGSYDEFLEMSQHGNNLALDLTVGDIYGKAGYPKYHVQASAVACCFGKGITSEDTTPNKEDIAASLLKGFTFQISSMACLMAKLIGSSRILYGGSHTHNHASIMDNIVNSVKFLSNGEMQAVFLRHEGFLGAIGALSSHKMIKFGKTVENKSFAQTAPIKQGDKGSPDAEFIRLQCELQKLQMDKAKLQAEIEKIAQDLYLLNTSSSRNI